jgi:hypothetical protein
VTLIVCLCVQGNRSLRPCEFTWSPGMEAGRRRPRKTMPAGRWPTIARTRYHRPVSSVDEAAGGRAGLLRLAEAWHVRGMADEVVSHTLSHGFILITPSGSPRSGARLLRSECALDCSGSPSSHGHPQTQQGCRPVRVRREFRSGSGIRLVRSCGGFAVQLPPPLSR